MEIGVWRARRARAKVNLRLRVTAPGDDGFHPIETVFCRISFSDSVRVRLRAESGVQLTLGGPVPVPTGPENIAWRAAESFLSAASLDCGAEIELEKRVPAGSGLGGGSSDAAAVLLLLNEAADTPLRQEVLQSLAAELGSDVPFFVSDAPLALAWGRGERLLECAPIEERPFLLVLTGIGIATATAYAQLDEFRERTPPPPPPPPPSSPPLRIDDVSSWEKLAHLAANDFEPVIFAHYPELAVLKQRLESTGPILSLLTGSGSAMFGVYSEEESARRAAEVLQGLVKQGGVISASGPV